MLDLLNIAYGKQIFAAEYDQTEVAQANFSPQDNTLTQHYINDF